MIWTQSSGQLCLWQCLRATKGWFFTLHASLPIQILSQNLDDNQESTQIHFMFTIPTSQSIPASKSNLNQIQTSKLYSIALPDSIMCQGLCFIVKISKVDHHQDHWQHSEHYIFQDQCLGRCPFRWQFQLLAPQMRQSLQQEDFAMLPAGHLTIIKVKGSTKHQEIFHDSWD